MDLNDFWQENKRWVLLCVAGLLVFLIARSIVDAQFNEPARQKRSKANAIYKSLLSKDGGFYLDQHESTARADRDRLGQSLGELRAAMHYALAPRYDLAGKGDAELRRATVFDEVRNAVFDRAAEINVEFLEEAFSWQPPTERDLIQRELIGVSVVEHVVGQLVAAHKAVTAADFEALGLRAITSFKMDRPAPRRGPRGPRDQAVKATDLLSEVAVTFKFEADYRTTHQFLENCRASSPKVILGQLKIVRGRRSGDPLKVEGEIRALTIKPLPSEEADS
jgi:hypothetical protein